MLLASGLTSAFLVAGVSAYRWLREDRGPAVLAALKTGVTLAAILIPVQIFVGDLHGLNTLEHQPQKIAAMEGVWETTAGAPLLLFAVPDEKARENKYEVAIPKLASLILTHDREGEIKGLNEYIGEHPPVAALFFSFRIMVGVGVLMLLVSWVAGWQVWRNAALAPWMARALVAMTFSGWIATVAGWYVTEIGRQPYLVYGVLRTADAASSVPAPMIGLSLGAYLLVYAVLLTAFITTVFYMAHKANMPVPAKAMTPVPGTATPPADSTVKQEGKDA